MRSDRQVSALGQGEWEFIRRWGGGCNRAISATVTGSGAPITESLAPATADMVAQSMIPMERVDGNTLHTALPDR